jgi:hypothetical protein
VPIAYGRNLETLPGDGGSSLPALEPRQNFKISNHSEDAAPLKNVFTPNLKEWAADSSSVSLREPAAPR